MKRFWWVGELKKDPKGFIKGLIKYIKERGWNQPECPFIELIAIHLLRHGNVKYDGYYFNQFIKRK